MDIKSIVKLVPHSVMCGESAYPGPPYKTCPRCALESYAASQREQRNGLEKLRELSDKATPGPWTRDEYLFVGEVKGGRPGGEVIGQAVPSRSGLLTLNQNRNNAAFIVACVNFVRSAILEGKV